MKRVVLPLADGGDGTLDVLSSAWKVQPRVTTVRGPLGKPVRASWAVARPSVFGRKKTAIIEMARASGLALTHGRNRIMDADTRGTGELMRAALDEGCRILLIGVGGTATGEGGAGALQALGLKYLDKKRRELLPTPNDLRGLVHVDYSGLDPRLARVKIFVLCDVTNPLLGPRGSARTFGPQKGATPAQVRALEDFLQRWARFARVKAAKKPGAGAAGALAFGLAGFAGARLVQGCPFIMDAVEWTQTAQRADIIISGEGRVDATSFQGKVVGEIQRRSHKPLYLVAGSFGLGPAELRRRNVHGSSALGMAGLRRPETELRAATRRLFSF